MIREEEITLNVVYVPNTVALLLPFLNTLLVHSSCQYRLVSNACTAEEEAILQEFAVNHDRVRFYSLEATHMLPHHKVLHRLLHVEDGLYFAFLDSDMVADGPFLRQMLTAMEGKDAIFTGLPMWHEVSEHTMPESFKIAGGRFYKTHNGRTLGLSYAAIYRRASLVPFMERTGLDFRRFEWIDVPIKYKTRLEAMGLRKQFYDTAKVINLFMEDDGYALVCAEVPNLIHFGGVSEQDAPDGKKMSLRQRLAKAMPPHLRHLYQILVWLKARVGLEEAKDMARLVQKRRITAALLGQYVKGEEVNWNHPDLHVLSQEIKANIQQKLARVSAVLRK